MDKKFPHASVKDRDVRLTGSQIKSMFQRWAQPNNTTVAAAVAAATAQQARQAVQAAESGDQQHVNAAFELQLQQWAQLHQQRQ